MRVLAALLVNALFNFVIGLVVARFLGPAEFGRFALAVALALVIQVAVLDWIRLAAIRFYSDEGRRTEPAIRATLDGGFATVALLLAAGTGVLLVLGPDLPLPPALVGLAVLTASVNGLFDYATGLLRASFQDRLYARLVIVKNALALVLTAGAAIVSASAPVALLGSALSLGGAVVLIRTALADPGSGMRLASAPLARRYLGYAAPIIVANLFYLAVPLLNRLLVTKLYGFAETGHFSLAWDFGQRSLQAIGSALDVLLFQMAVAVHARDGLAPARQAVARNLGLILAALLPATIGIWLVLPSVEALIVPAEFRGPFAQYLTLMLPGLLALSVASYGINPAFQIEKRTWPLIAAACVALAGTPVFLLLLWAVADEGWRGVAGLAVAQSLSYGAALLVLAGFGVRYAGLRLPPARDLGVTGLGCAALLLSGVVLRALTPGLVTLALQVSVGAAVYGAVVLLFDLGGFRAIVLRRARDLLGSNRAPRQATNSQPYGASK